VILPIAFALVLWVAWRRRDLLGGYHYPKWLLGVGAIVLILEFYLGWNSLTGIADLWN
jgi:Mn2+/Fe2+ NRAMP family transporter